MKLTVDDLFLLSEIADKMDLTLPDPTKISNGKKEDKTQSEYGKEIIEILVKKAYKAKEPIKELITNVTGKPTSDMSPKELFDTFRELLKQEGVLSFFKSADSLESKK